MWERVVSFMLVSLVGLALAPSVLGQAEQLVSGSVVTKDGAPIAGVAVYGNSCSCCPFKHRETTTDEKGEFHLLLPGAVIHFLKEDFQPQAIVTKPGTSEVRITMEAAINSLVVPLCEKPGSGEKRIGWGNHGLQFTVPEQLVEISLGEPDVDYVRHVIKAKAGESYLGLWFGPFAFSLDPDNELFAYSDEFAQRNVVTANGAFVGIDSWGHLRNGRHWRQMAIIGEGQAVYREARSDETNLFDQIISSMCTVPYSSR